jgi:deoxyribodipyrimidine photo-lyase
MSRIPALRIRPLNEARVRPEGDFVLYWMTAYRRTSWNYALDRAIARARELDRPLVVFEALRAGYPWASDRIHQFVMDGMVDNGARLARGPALYYPYLESRPGDGRGLLSALGEHACAVITDDFPSFFLPRMLAAAARQVPVLLEAVDSNGLLPMRAADRVFPTAYSFRRFLHKALPAHLDETPAADPLRALDLTSMPSLPDPIESAWPRAWPLEADGRRDALPDLAGLQIDHAVGPVEYSGGAMSGSRVLRDFLLTRLEGYAAERNQPEVEASSGLSPYLHFGHVSAHAVFHALRTWESWSRDDLGEPTGKRAGWWGMSEPAEAFLDELVTWRELGFNRGALSDTGDRFESIPDWAQATLAEHADDPRKYRYDLATFDEARTHDSLWNAAQNQLRREGRIHNYLRMLWGKKILEWSASPRDAYDVMVELNNRYAVDGRDPNSYTGILWVLGMYDRAWGPERPIFGKVRYMSSENTARKVRVREYMREYAKVS